MNDLSYKSEIRESVVRELREKVRKQNYANYLVSLRLEKIRLFQGGQISFDFPVTALIGPNGGGKSTILGASACIYSRFQPQNIFRKSRIGDEGMDNWRIEYEGIDKSINPKGTIRSSVSFEKNQWFKQDAWDRDVKLLGINRTVPVTENHGFSLRKRLSMDGTMKQGSKLSYEEVEGVDEIKSQAEKILGKSLSEFKLLKATFTRVKTVGSGKSRSERKLLEDGTQIITIHPPSEHVLTKSVESSQLLYIGSNGGESYSEFNFGAGEASVIRMVADIESQRDGSLILIEEIENGLHPLAVRRMVEYLIDAAKRKNVQVIFTTHSDYAIAPLPSEAIWSSIDGRLQQGKLSVEVLRAVSGRVDKKLAVFVEDEFAKVWTETIIREKLGDKMSEIGVYPVYGDGNAVKVHENHQLNPSISFRSMCILDGDSPQTDNASKGIFRLSGQMPESEVFDSVRESLTDNLALLTAACQRPLSKQKEVMDVVNEVSSTNRDAHLLFSQIGGKLGLIPEATIRGAFITIWIQQKAEEADRIADAISATLELPDKGVGIHAKS